MPGFDLCEEKNGRAASFLQVSRSTCHHPRPPPPTKKIPKSKFLALDSSGKKGTHRSTRSPTRTVASTHRRQYLLTRTLESSRGRQFRFLWAAGLQPPPRLDIQQGTPGLQQREAESCPKAPGNAAGRGEGTRKQKRIRLQPKAGSGRVNPGSKGAAPLYLQTIHLAGGRGRRSRAERPEQQPPGHPAPGRSCVWGSPAGAGDAHPSDRPNPHPLPGPGQELPRESQAGRGRRSPHLPKVHRLALRARSPWSRSPARVGGAPGRLGCDAGGRVCTPPPGPARRAPGLARASPQVREPERECPCCRRRFLPGGCGIVRASSPESAPSSGRQPLRLSQRAAAARSPPGFPSPSPVPRVSPPSPIARRSPPRAEPALSSREPGSPAPSLAPSRPLLSPPPLLPPPTRCPEGTLPASPGRAQANQRPGWAVDRGGGGVLRPRPPRPTPGPLESLFPVPPGSWRGGAGPLRGVCAGLAFPADPPSSPAFPLLWGEGAGWAFWGAEVIFHKKHTQHSVHSFSLWSFYQQP